MEKLHYNNCPLCKSENFDSHMPIDDHSISKEHFKLCRCNDCNFIFTQDVPKEENAGPYYQSEDYISHSNTSKGIVNKLYHIVRDHMLSRKHKLIRSLHKGNKILDVGAGTGYFLNYMKQQGYQTLGIEVDADARVHGQKEFGLDIRSPKELKENSIKESFHIISLWHVLEHLYRPESYMQHFHRLLEDDGYLLIALPNANSYDAQHYKAYWAAYDVPRHLWHFTPSTLEKLANDNGFELTKMKDLPFDPFYNAMLSEKYKNNALAFISGGFIGFLSLLKGKMNVKKASSVIYILKKK